MALLMFESFDNWNTLFNGTADAPTFPQGVLGSTGTGNWQNAVISNTSTNSLGKRTIQVNANQLVKYNLGASNTNTAFIGFRIVPLSVGALRDIFAFYDSANAVQCGLSINASNKLVFWRGTNATALGTGTTNVLSGVDYYIEMSVPLGNSVTVEVRVNGVTDINVSTVDTTNTANQNWQYFGFAVTNVQQFFSDLYCCDSSGSAPYNTFLGGSGASFTGIRVENLYVTTNNSVTWTPLSSTNASNVDDTSIDSSTYNKTSTLNNIDTFNHGSLSSNPTTIFGVKVQHQALKEDVALRSTRTKLISGGTTSNGVTFPLTTTYETSEDYYNNDPNTAAAWTASNVNATKIGYELVL